MTKIHASCPHENYAAALLLAAGNINDYTAFEPLYRGREAENVAVLTAADKGPDSTAICEPLAGYSIEPVITLKSNRLVPPDYDRDIYRQRNHAELFFNNRKHFRGMTTRYPKFAGSFLALAQITAAFIFARNL